MSLTTASPGELDPEILAQRIAHSLRANFPRSTPNGVEVVRGKFREIRASPPAYQDLPGADCLRLFNLGDFGAYLTSSQAAPLFDILPGSPRRPPARLFNCSSKRGARFCVSRQKKGNLVDPS